MIAKSYLIRANILHKGIFSLVVLSGLLLTFAAARAQVATEPPPMKITQGWQYRWGDSPIDESP